MLSSVNPIVLKAKQIRLSKSTLAQSEVEVFYDPSQPEASTLEPGANSGSIIIAIIGLIWTAICSLLLFLMLKPS